METQKCEFFSKKFEFWFLTKSWNHLSFVDISPTLVIDTSMEWSSRVLHHGNPKMWIFFKKLEINEIEFCPYPEFPYAEKRNRPGFVNISPTSVIDTSTKRSSSTTTWEPKIWFFFQKVWNWIWLVMKSWNQHSSRSHLYMSTSGMHRRPFEGRHLVLNCWFECTYGISFY